MQGLVCVLPAGELRPAEARCRRRVSYLPNGVLAFVSLDIAMRSRNIDVNIRARKVEVRFLHDAQLVPAVVAAIEESIKAGGKAGTFRAHTQLGMAMLRMLAMAARVLDGTRAAVETSPPST